MFEAIKASFRRKKARRYFAEYPYEISCIPMGKYGEIEYARWQNPLIIPGEPREAQVDFFKKFLNEGDLALDIGANVGAVTIPMSMATGTNGKVISFDPNHYIFKILEKNASLNKDKTNIDAVNCAIADEPGDFYYNSSEASFANGGISKEPVNQHGKFQINQKVKGIKLSEFLNENYAGKLNDLKLIKIDTEGLDRIILSSIKDIIRAYQPMVIAECIKTLSPEDKQALFEELAMENYDLFYFEDFDANVSIEPLNRKNVPTDTFNFYGHPKQKS